MFAKRIKTDQDRAFQKMRKLTRNYASTVRSFAGEELFNPFQLHQFWIFFRTNLILLFAATNSIKWDHEHNCIIIIRLFRKVKQKELTLRNFGLFLLTSTFCISMSFYSFSTHVEALFSKLCLLSFGILRTVFESTIKM